MRPPPPSARLPGAASREARRSAPPHAEPIAPEPRVPAIDGTRLSHYRLLHKLGEGGMGAVYRAEDVRLGRHVALKLLPGALAHDEKARARFLTEARAVAALDHPNICLLYELGEEGGQLFLAMQLVEGATLRDLLAAGPLDEARTRAVVRAVASALAAAHARGIVHRDVKSENVLMGADGSIKLADFGVARLAESAGVTSASAVVGTPAYLAPELMLGGEVTPAVDQFALAVVAFECLAGTLPFPGSTLAARLHAILNSPPPRLSDLRPGLDPRWDSALMRAMAPDPGRRFPSIGSFAGALDPDFTTTPAEGSPVAAFPDPADRGAAPPRTLAVLPFENRSGDSARDYFCAGITEDLMTDLARVPGLRVASRHAVARYAGPRDDTPRVARELGVSAVLEGDVRWAGERVRITSRLLDGKDGFQIWAERYDRAFDDVFSVQDDLAHAIAAALRAALTPTMVAELRRARPREAEAYDAYLRGRELYRRYTPAENRQALERFEHAVQLDPAYALAWAGIADCCAQVCDKRWDPDPDWATRGFAAARRAVELDPRLAEAHKAEALLWRARRDHERAMAALLLALDADPRSIPALINLAHEQLGAGDLAAGERTLRRAVAVDSAYAFGHLMLGLVLLYTRRFEEAVRSCDAALHEGASGFYVEYVYPMRAHALALLGRFDAAREEVAMGLAAGAPAPILGAARALVAALAGERDEAARGLALLDALPPRESYGCELAARAAGALGDAGGTVRWLRAAEAIDDRHPATWRLAPEFDAVRGRDEFERHLGDRGRRLVWPSEAPALGNGERERFASVTLASGRSAG